MTVKGALARFFDGLPGRFRSAKLEQVLRGYRRSAHDAELRHALAATTEGEEERLESEAWRRTLEED
ncbi:MAG TPA: hypothetical protein VN923_10075 [Thermoanaerobaculia bacterium]|nr:hypothetical protein [Thermoanaerobaculia bacterium]